jgi:hypothetical protein
MTTNHPARFATTNNTTTPNAPRTFDVERKHGVGQFLRAHPEALRVVKRLHSEQRDWDTLGAHIKDKGYGA